MPRSGLIDPLRRPAFRRLAISYAVNELGDWLGIVALSVLVFDLTGSALATAALFLGTRFLPALLAPLLVARAERPPPRFVLPAIYAARRRPSARWRCSPPTSRWPRSSRSPRSTAPWR